MRARERGGQSARRVSGQVRLRNCAYVRADQAVLQYARHLPEPMTDPIFVAVAAPTRGGSLAHPFSRHELSRSDRHRSRKLTVRCRIVCLSTRYIPAKYTEVPDVRVT